MFKISSDGIDTSKISASAIEIEDELTVGGSLTVSDTLTIKGTDLMQRLQDIENRLQVLEKISP
jgi:hypothetical protein